MTTATTFKLNISSVKRFKECRARWLVEWHLNRVPTEGALPLNLGKLVHLVFETHLAEKMRGGTMSMAEAMAVELHNWNASATLLHGKEQQDMTDAAEAFRTLAEPLSHWVDEFPITRVLEVEEPFEYPHPDDPTVVIRGRPDRMAIVYDRGVHIQNRTLASGINFGLYTELAKRDYHELIYAWAMKQKYPDLKYGGTLMNLIRKLKYRGVPTKACPEGKILHELSEIFGQYMVPMLSAQIDHALRDILWDANEMRRTIQEYEDKGVFPSPNRKLDGGPYGNKIDPYFGVFMGKVSVDDPEYFKPREEMYAPTGEDTP